MWSLLFEKAKVTQWSDRFKSLVRIERKKRSFVRIQPRSGLSEFLDCILPPG